MKREKRTDISCNVWQLRAHFATLFCLDAFSLIWVPRALITFPLESPSPSIEERGKIADLREWRKRERQKFCILILIFLWREGRREVNDLEGLFTFLHERVNEHLEHFERWSLKWRSTFTSFLLFRLNVNSHCDNRSTVCSCMHVWAPFSYRPFLFSQQNQRTRNIPGFTFWFLISFTHDPIRDGLMMRCVSHVKGKGKG